MQVLLHRLTTFENFCIINITLPFINCLLLIMEDIHEEGKDENDIDLDILPQIMEHNILESSLGEYLGRCRSWTRVLDLNHYL